MKILSAALFATATLLVLPGCADQGSTASHRHHHRRHTPSDSTSDTAATTAKPASPQDAGASNAALGTSARDALGHPAIDSY